MTVNNRIGGSSDRRTWRLWLAALVALVIVVAVVFAVNGRSAASSRSAASGAKQNTANTAQSPQSGGMTQTSEGGQVTVAATWQGPTAGPVFRVALNTHAVDLSAYDLRQLAVLRTDQGREARPSRWDAPISSHHREGTLTFPATGSDGRPLIGSGTRAIELIIRDVAGVPARTFRWTL